MGYPLPNESHPHIPTNPGIGHLGYSDIYHLNLQPNVFESMYPYNPYPCFLASNSISMSKHFKPKLQCNFLVLFFYSQNSFHLLHCTMFMQYAHRNCVQQWCNEKGDISCEICHQVGLLWVKVCQFSFLQ